MPGTSSGLIQREHGVANGRGRGSQTLFNNKEV